MAPLIRPGYYPIMIENHRVKPNTNKEKAIIPRRPERPEILRLPSLADVISGKVKGRTDDKQTSWFLNLGVMGVQFAAVCTVAYHEAIKRGIGNEIPTEWFTQSIRD